MGSTASKASDSPMRPFILSNDGAADDRKRARTNAPARAPSNGFALADFVAPEVVRFLGVRSLVRFGAACKDHETVVTREVARRRERVAAVEAEVRLLMGPRPEITPPREDFAKAKRLVGEAKRLIGTEINFHFHESLCMNKEQNLADDTGSQSWRDGNVFLQEWKKFLVDPPGPLYLLPDCFYFPPEGNSRHSSQEEIRSASAWVSILSTRFQRIDQYDHDFAHVRELLDETVMWAARHGMLDAYRIASRMEFFRNPISRNYLWHTLEEMDDWYILEEIDLGAGCWFCLSSRTRVVVLVTN